MTVLTLAGKPINWDKPPKATAQVMWSQRTTGGKIITGSLRTIAHLDHLNTLAKKKFGVGLVVYQGPNTKGYAPSAGTHDFDACLDIWIPGVDGYVQQAFIRANGGGGYFRTLAQGFTPHIHYFTLPQRRGSNVSDDFREGGFKVGKYVDGGWSTVGYQFTSSQIEDYYNERTALSGHAADPTWFPEDKAATIFNLHNYIERQRKAQGPPKPKGDTKVRVAVINCPVGGGEDSWRVCFRKTDVRSGIFGINESFNPKQRAVFAEEAKVSNLGYHGLHKCGNPIFWEGENYKFLSGRVHEIHPAADNALARKYPGFNEARTINETVLRRVRDGVEFAVLNTHLVPNGPKVDPAWRRKVRAKSKRMLRSLAQKHRKAGRVVVVEGDMNIYRPFSLGRGMRWLRGKGIDKIGSNMEGTAVTYDAPTDHKHGVQATLTV